VGDSDGADGVASKAGEPAAGDKAKDRASKELGGGADSLTRSG
jgi:hypothetical protein